MSQSFQGDQHMQFASGDAHIKYKEELEAQKLADATAKKYQQRLAQKAA